MAKEPKEKKSKVKKVKDKAPKEKKEKKGKKTATAADVAVAEAADEGGGGGKKKLVIIGVLLLLILGGGAGSAYFLVYLPMQEEAASMEDASNVVEAQLEVQVPKPRGYFGYLSHNAAGNNQLFIDGVDIIYANETLLIEEMGLTEDQLSAGYYISNPQAATRIIYVDASTIYNIISRETGEYIQVAWSQFVEHLSTSAILFEFTSSDNTLRNVTEFPVKNFVLPEIEEPEVEILEEETGTDEPEVPVDENTETPSDETTAPTDGTETPEDGATAPEDSTSDAETQNTPTAGITT
ncbi:MAG: hypothetical protein R3Y63_00805 [Eubacteriales bacterium]